MTTSEVGWEDILREVEDMYKSMTAEGCHLLVIQVMQKYLQ